MTFGCTLVKEVHLYNVCYAWFMLAEQFKIYREATGEAYHSRSTYVNNSSHALILPLSNNSVGTELKWTNGRSLQPA